MLLEHKDHFKDLVWFVNSNKLQGDWFWESTISNLIFRNLNQISEKNMGLRQKLKSCTGRIFCNIPEDRRSNRICSTIFTWCTPRDALMKYIVVGRPDWWQGGVLRFGLDGFLLLEPWNPAPFQGSFWQKKVPIFRDFSWNVGPFFAMFGCLHGKHQKFLKKRPMFRDIFVKMGTMRPMFRDFLWKSDAFEWHIPIYLNMWVPWDSWQTTIQESAFIWFFFFFFCLMKLWFCWFCPQHL